MRVQQLCEGLPKEFIEYLEYVRKLRFDESPDYSQLRTSFLQLFAREGGLLYVGAWEG